MVLMPRVCACLGFLISTSAPSRMILAGAFLISPAQDFHERGFAGAVLTEEDMNFAAPQLEINVVQSHDAGKRLPDVTHFQNGGSAIL